MAAINSGLDFPRFIREDQRAAPGAAAHPCDLAPFEETIFTEGVVQEDPFFIYVEPGEGFVDNRQGYVLYQEQKGIQENNQALILGIHRDWRKNHPYRDEEQ